MRIELRDVSFSYPERGGKRIKALSGVNLMIHKGECVGVIGPEGAGKTTLLYLLDGLLKPDRGTVEVEGKDIWSRPKELAEARRGIGVAFQFPERQFLTETVHDELMLMQTTDRIETARAALSEVGLDPSGFLSRSVRSLSVGEARRVALAVLRMTDHDLLLLDEPTAGLDGHGHDQLRRFLFRQNEEGTSVVIVTHDLELLSEIASRVLILNNGELHAESAVGPLLMDADSLFRYGYDLPGVVCKIDELYARGRLKERKFMRPEEVRKLLGRSGSSDQED